MLEIKINEVCHTVDSYEEAVEFVVAEIKRWFNSSDETPLTLALTKIINRGPPTLEISIGERLPTKEALR
jgi:hypothetical protein